MKAIRGVLQPGRLCPLRVQWNIKKRVIPEKEKEWLESYSIYSHPQSKLKEKIITILLHQMTDFSSIKNINIKKMT